MGLTEVEFWEDYWAGCKLPATIDEGFSFERCLAEELRKNLSGIKGEVLEVGCAPGKWLAFAAKEMGLKPSGIEYTRAGMAATVKNLKMLDIKYGDIWEGDFFKLRPSRLFDVVMSFGFIEHFEDVDDVVRLHMEWLRPGGMLILGVPNFRGVYRPVQAILDKEILDKHNLEIMTPDYFRGLAQRHGLLIKSLGYIGSFEPALPMIKPGSGGVARTAIKGGLKILSRLRRLKAFDSVNSRFFSSYILAVYQKKAES